MTARKTARFKPTPSSSVSHRGRHPRKLNKLVRTVGTAAVTSAILAATLGAGAGADERTDFVYQEAIDNTESMVENDRVIALAAEHQLDVVNVAWEDTGRYDNSSVGPNISDVTIQVAGPPNDDGEHSLSLMPVIRYPNFTDKTGDVAIDKFYLPVGNENDDDLRPVTLEEYLGNIGRYLSDQGRPDRNISLLADRDSHVLVSAQAAFLPVPNEGLATFNPVIFNYQSSPANPAILTIVATAQGTSATVIDNGRDGFGTGQSWGQRLFFNQAGERASFTGQRASESESNLGSDKPSETTSDAPADAEAGFARGDTRSEPAVQTNTVLIIQVPLQHESSMTDSTMMMEDESASESAETDSSDVEDALIGYGDVEGPFTELDGLAIERDPDFPVRATVQYYKATATGQPTADDIDTIARDIDRVYDDADFVGSLVVDGLTGRPTEYDGEHTEPADWWGRFCSYQRAVNPWSLVVQSYRC